MDRNIQRNMLFSKCEGLLGRCGSVYSDCDKSSSLQQTSWGLMWILALSEGQKAEGGPGWGSRYTFPAAI